MATPLKTLRTRFSRRPENHPQTFRVSQLGPKTLRNPRKCFRSLLAKLGGFRKCLRVFGGSPGPNREPRSVLERFPGSPEKTCPKGFRRVSLLRMSLNSWFPPSRALVKLSEERQTKQPPHPHLSSEPEGQGYKVVNGSSTWKQ
jgi:hypothetical protein